jgi:(p)ppGpp synthase/HD superfamily hydrolase
VSDKKLMEEHGLVFPRSQDMVDWAYTIAKGAHQGQARKYTGRPYIEHPVSVAQKVNSYWPDLPSVLAALLHDTVEDTHYTFQDLLGNKMGLGGTVVEYVWWLTDDKREPSNRKTRKTLQSWRLSAAPVQVKIVKLADLIDNGEGKDGIIVNDPDFAKKYMREAAALVHGALRPYHTPLQCKPTMLDIAHQSMWEEANEMITRYNA